MANRLPIYDTNEPVGPDRGLALANDLSRLGRNWGWLMAGGIAFILFGIAAFAWPIRSTYGLTITIGVLLAVSGIAHLIQSIQLRKEAGNGWRVFQAVIALDAGILMLRFPASGMMGIAIALTFYFFVSAAVKGVIAMGLRPLKGWGWAMASAVASMILGVYMIATFPVSALWVPGILLGIDLIVYGSSLIGFSLALKNVHRRIRGATERPPVEREAA